MQLFNALNGDEVKKIILADIARTLEADSELQPHICFPRVSWRWKLEMDIYPRTPNEKVVEVTGEAIQVQDNGTPVVAAAETHIREVYSSPSREIVAPDKIRQEEGLAINEARSALSPFQGKKGLGGPQIEVGRAATNPVSLPRQGRGE
jgi:hypothetical protein